MEKAITDFKSIPTDENFQRIAMCATLIAIKETADSLVIHELLEQMASDTIPFLSASAN